MGREIFAIFLNSKTELKFKLSKPITISSNKTGYPVTGGATLAVSVNFISKLACYIQKVCDKKKIVKKI